jgi:hypothetical protein
MSNSDIISPVKDLLQATEINDETDRGESKIRGSVQAIINSCNLVGRASFVAAGFASPEVGNNSGDFVSRFKQYVGSKHLNEISKSKVMIETDNDAEDHLSVSFCPDLLYEYLQNVQTDPILLPETRYFNGALLLVDVSGFTKLSGQLCDMGTTGLDLLQVNMKDYIGRVIDIVYSYNGDGKYFHELKVQI